MITRIVCIRRFLADTSGTMTMEAVIMFPLMFWLLIFGPITFDIVRERTAVVRNTYTVAKGVAQETSAVSDEYLQFTQSAFQELFPGNPDAGLRISEFRKNSDTKAVEVNWEAENINGYPDTLESNIDALQTIFPHFISGECVLMIEGWRNYSSIIQWKFGGWTLGWKDKRIEHRIFVRPRFETCIGRKPS